MNEDHPSDAETCVDSSAGTVANSPALTQADDTSSSEVPSSCAKTDGGESAGTSGLEQTLAGDSIGLQGDRTLAEPTLPDNRGPGQWTSSGERTTRGDDVSKVGGDPTLPSVADDVRSSRSRRPMPTIPGYEILDELGRGGMGVVYLARQIRLNRFCALKMILGGDRAESSDGAAVPDRGAETIARLRHTNIAQIYQIGDHDGLVFLEMEYIEGGSLEKQLNGTPWPARKAAELVSAFARGVGQAHRHGVVHRDLKPGNILLDRRRRPQDRRLRPGEAAGSVQRG